MDLKPNKSDENLLSLNEIVNLETTQYSQEINPTDYDFNAHSSNNNNNNNNNYDNNNDYDNIDTDNMQLIMPDDHPLPNLSEFRLLVSRNNNNNNINININNSNSNREENNEGEELSAKSTIKMAFFNMANSIMGAGIIGQPYAMRQTGLIAGLILLIFLTIITDWTLRLIVINSKLSGSKTYQGTVSTCFGKSGLIFTALIQWVFAFGGSAAFCVIIGDTFPKVLLSLFPNSRLIPFISLLTYRRPLIVILVTFIGLPLCLIRDISKLSNSSIIALIGMIFIIFTVIIEAPLQNSDIKGEMSLSLWTVNFNILQGISVISFAFVCHHNTLFIYDSLKKPTLDRFSFVTHLSTGISMIACIAIALGGFLSFKSKTQGNILNNFPMDNLLVDIARLCFGLNMLTTLPLEIFVCREVFINYFFDSSEYSQTRHLIVTICTLISAMLISLMSCDLGIILELIGATSACSMSYILPPLCYIKLSKKSTRQKIPAYVCVCFGLVVLLFSTTQSIIKLFNSNNEVVCDA